jgi:hypothetical protein
MTNFTGWQYYTGEVKNQNGQITTQNIGIRIVNGNAQQSRSLQDPEVAKWLAAGNTPLPAENA